MKCRIIAIKEIINMPLLFPILGSSHNVVPSMSYFIATYKHRKKTGGLHTYHVRTGGVTSRRILRGKPYSLFCLPIHFSKLLCYVGNSTGGGFNS